MTPVKTISPTLLIAATLMLGGGAVAQQRLMIYPAAGQSDEQLSQDRFECHLWAVGESGFDPSNPPPDPPAGTIRVPVGENPNEGAAAKGTIAGAVVGGVIGSERKDMRTPEGAIIGAVIGSVIGSAIEEKGAAEAQQRARAEANSTASQRASARAELARAREDYQRALSACLDGRGYVVK